MKKILEILAPARLFIGHGLSVSTARLVTTSRRPCGSLLMSFLIVALLLSTSARGQEVVHEAFPETVPVTKRAVSQQGPVPVSLGLAGAFQEGRNVHDMGRVSAEEMAAAEKAAAKEFADVQPGPLRVGVVRSVGPVPLSIESGSALQIQLAGGEKVWTLAIRSPGAFGIRIHFSNFNVGKGSAIVYARDGGGLIVRGPYTGKGPDSRGEFWTESLPGDTAFIEVSGTDEPRLEVAEIVHRDKDPAGSAQELKGATAPPPAEPPLSCHLDVMCSGNPPVNPSARDAVGRAFFVKADREEACTGTLLDDLDPDTFVPYFLTANHCISTQAVANTLEVVYLWQRSSCDGPLPNFFLLPRSTGGTLLEHTSQHGGNDMSFIRLRGNVPDGVTLAGWTTADQGDHITGIHHPGGGTGVSRVEDWKRVTFMHENFIDVVLGPACDIGGVSPVFYQRLEIDSGGGMIQGGSSGSGIFNNDGQLMGQALAFCGLTSVPHCDNRNLFLVAYGRFFVTFPFIQRWLEIGGTVNVNRFFVGSELGTPTQPFRTVNGANNLINDQSWDGARIRIQAGSYNEALPFSRQMTVIANGGTVTIGAP